MNRNTRNNWVDEDMVSEEDKLSMLNYYRDYWVIEYALMSLEKLKRDTLPEHINLQTNAFSVILDSIWEEIQRIKEFLVYPTDMYIPPVVSKSGESKSMFDVVLFKTKSSVLGKK